MRLIDADALECISYTGIPDGYDNTFDSGVLWTLDKADEIPTVDAVPVRRGKWKPDSDNCLVCSECGNPAEINGITGEFMKSPYCSECGAKME